MDEDFENDTLIQRLTYERPTLIAIEVDKACGKSVTILTEYTDISFGTTFGPS